jgi:hypothetical protein
LLGNVSGVVNQDSFPNKLRSRYPQPHREAGEHIVHPTAAMFFQISNFYTDIITTANLPLSKNSQPQG